MSEDKRLDERINTKAIIITTIVGILSLGIGFISGKEVGRQLPATHKNYSNSKVIATVGDSKITEKQLRQKVEPLFHIRGKQKVSEEELQAFEASMLDYLTTTEVLYLEGKAEGIKVTKEEVETEYTNIMDSINQQFKLTEEEITGEIKIPKEDIEKTLEKELVATKYIGEKSKISEEEVAKYYDENKEEFLKVRASHILIKTTNENGEALSEDEIKSKEKEAEKILEKAKAGEDFESLAKEYSQDGSASNGGDLDYFMKDQMVPEFEKAAFEIEVGQINDKLVKTDFGYHIIKKTDEKYEELENIKENLEYSLSYEKQNKILDELIEKYDVQVNK